MITKITESNNEFYEALFEEVSKILQNFVDTYIDEDSEDNQVDSTNGVVINIALKENPETPYVYYNMGIPETIDFTKNTDIAIKLYQAYLDVDKGNVKGLEEYFGIIETLTNCIDTNYQILPLVARDGQWVKDEVPFIIDADTRAIQVPNNNYTYAVSGDDLAETIYFVIDRYFDNVDLTTKNIAVLSQINNQKILTPITLKDITSLPDKIIFGWPISKILTANTSGTLEFSVRFYTLDGTTIDYSLNTVPARLNIKPTLDFFQEEGVITDEASERVKNLLANADINSTAAVKPPVFHLGEGEKKIKNLKDGSLPLNLEAAAHSLDSLPISYYWTQMDSNGSFKKIDGSDNDHEDSIEYIEIPYENLEQEIEKYGIFYVGEDKVQKVLQVGEEHDPDETYYRQGSSQTVDVAGQYQCVAVAKRGLIRQKASRSAIFEIPSPSEIILQRSKSYENKELKFLFDEGETTDSKTVKDALENIIETKYVTDSPDYTGNISSNLTLVKDNNYTLTRTHTLNNATTNASFKDIIIYKSLPKPEIEVSETSIDDATRTIKVSLKNFNNEYMTYTITLENLVNNTSTEINAESEQSISKNARYNIEVQYSSQYNLLNGQPASSSPINQIIDTYSEPSQPSFIL